MRFFHPTLLRVAVMLMVFMGTRSLLAAETTSPVREWRPKTFQLHWKNPSPEAEVSSVTIQWDGEAVHYDVTRPSSRPVLNSDHRTIKPGEAAWREFWQRMEEMKVWQWARDYGTRPDGSESWYWNLEFKLENRHVKSSGLNAFPDLRDANKAGDHPAVFHRLWHAVDRLVAIEVEVEGTYFAGFEMSVFMPSSGTLKGQRWWLHSNREFYQRYTAFSPKGDLSNSVYAGPKVFARLRGRLTGPGRYGHMDQYGYEFDVTEVLEMKLEK